MDRPYTDHHVHLLSTAAARLSIDVSRAGDLAQMAAAIQSGLDARSDGWIRAWGYEEWSLAEGRHPTREDLDRVVADRPLVLHHRSGHVAVLNGCALEQIGQGDHGDGVLFDRHDLLERVPRLPLAALRAAAGTVSQEWSYAGVGAAVDATHTNGPAEFELLASLVSSGVVTQEITAMASVRALGSLPPYGSSVGPVKVGWAKIMPGPDPSDEISSQVAAAHEAGYPVAVHVVDVGVLDATLDAFERSSPPSGAVDRIEHNALCLPEQVERIAASGAMVVVNPGFLLHRRKKYEMEVSQVERPWLVRIRSLLAAGVEVRAGSDSPVTPSSPADIVAAASAHPFCPDESVTTDVAERLLRPRPAPLD